MIPLRTIKRMIRRYGMVYRILADMRDLQGARFAVERASLWRMEVNKRKRRK